MNNSTLFYIFSAASIVGSLIWLFQTLKINIVNPNKSDSKTNIEKLNPANNLFGIITAAAFALSFIFYFSAQQQLLTILNSENIERTDSMTIETTTKDTAITIEETTEIRENKTEDYLESQETAEKEAKKKSVSRKEKKQKDTDGDGIIDEKDVCPKVAGPAKNKGCPEIKKQKPEKEKTDYEKALEEWEKNNKK